MNSDYKLLGWSFKRTPENKNQTQPIVPKDINDGSLIYSVLPDSYGTIGTGWSTNEVDSAIKSDAELVNKYREMSLNPIIDRAISEIANEAITMSETDIVKLNLEKVVNLPLIAKTKITESFEEILNLLNYRLNGYSSFRQWYVDGRIYYHTMIDIKDPTRGIVDIRNIDPRKIKKIKEVVKKRSKNSSGVSDAVITDTKNEYYIFNDSGFVGKRAKANGIKLTLDSVAYATSGLNAVDGVSTLSYLHYASRYLNQLTTTENAMVIYMLARAPERRTWYIDTGNLPTMKAEQYVQSVMNRYKNKVVYDATTGEVRDDRKYMTMLEDFFLPRRNGSRGTEVNTLPAGQATTQMDNVEYFKRQLYESLNVPTERLNASNPFSSGMDTAISREEIKFGKFIERLRQQYSEIFRQLLGKQIILKNIITEDEWNDFKNEIVFDFSRDNFFLEMKDSEATKLKLSVIEAMESAQIIGRYVSNETVRKKILKQTEEEIKKEDELIIKEKSNPIFNIPSIDPNTGLPMPDLTSLALNNQYAQVPLQTDQQDQSSTSNSSQNNAKN